MAAKTQPSGTSASQLSLVDQLLSSRISLPPNPSVYYTLYTADNNSNDDASENIETARRQILSQNASATLLESSLTSAHIGSTSFLYVFRIAGAENATQVASSMGTFRFNGLNVLKSSSFAFAHLFPCSQSCSAQEIPCSNCNATTPTTANSSSLATLLPRKPFQTVYSHFLEAVRIRLLDDVAKAAVMNASRRHVKRLKGGFLVGTSLPKSEWTSSWEYRALSRPLLYCQLQVHFSWHPHAGLPSLIIHPLLHSTHFLPLTYTLPLPSGTLITLLPHGTPAYFLTHYTGPTSALTRQFQESLRGLGVAGWEGSTEQDKAAPGINGLPYMPEYIIAWIKVENRQGEDKGILAIYPTALCLSFTPSSTTRQMLECIPELPTPLQPSPLLSAAVVVAPSRAQSTTSPVDGSDRPSPTTSAPPALSYPLTPSSYLAQPRPMLPSSPTCESLRAFRSLTLSKSKDIRTVADKVSSYVDAIAKERDRERERLKRERETSASSSPKFSRNASNTNSQIPASTPITIPSSAPAPSHTTTPANNNHVTTSLLTTPLTNMHPVAASTSQMSTPGQNFYPSPPHAESSSVVPPSDAIVSPSIEVAPALPSSNRPVEKTDLTSSPPPESSSAPTYGPYNNPENSWPSQSYLGMDMDIDFDMGMDMGFDMDTGAGAGRGGDGVFSTSGNGMDFDTAFTDDDFNFFDSPITPAHPRNAGNLNLSSAAQTLTTAQFPSGLTQSFTTPASSPVFSPNNISGPSHLNAQVPSTPQCHTLTPPPWVTSAATPGFGDPHASGAKDSGNLFPLSPGQTPSTMQSHSVPTTPRVSVQLRPPHPAIRQPSASGALFDPIPFSEYHREMDGKYAVGKFSLPSPPPEEEEDKTLTWPPAPSSSSRSLLGLPFLSKSAGAGGGFQNAKAGWRAKYLAVTDPRIGVVKKLIGVKRKLAPEPNSREFGRNVQASPSWIRELEDWQNVDAADADTPEAIPDEDSDDDSSDGLPEDILAFSRPSTPLPHYLPLGPTLLHTHFQHGMLLPLSKPLRPPGAAVAPTNISASSAALSVPTPMSPAAGFGAANEKSKSLEAAAYTLAREVVENPPWAESWRASGSLADGPKASIWPVDVRIVASLINIIPGCEGPLQLEEVFGISKADATAANATSSHGSLSSPVQKPLRPLETPFVTVAKGDSIMHILPTAVRFWEKIGIGPRGGKKDGVVFALFEDEDGQRQVKVENWLSMITSTWQSKHLGVLTPGKSVQCPKDGIVPLRFGSFWKSLTSCIAGIPALNGSLIFFVVTPPGTMSLASPILRQVFSAIKKAFKTYSEAQIHFQLIPECLLHGNHSNPAAAFSDAQLVCYSLYDRILVPVDRSMSRRLYDYGERVRRYFQEPIATLARDKYVKTEVEYKRKQDVTLDAMDKGTFLHVGYAISDCGKWLLAACVDQRGEAHDLGVWLTGGEVEPTDGSGQTISGSNEGYSGRDEVLRAATREHILISRVWSFLSGFSQRANVEWRIIISRLGIMPEGEINAWANLLEDKRLAHRVPRFHVSLLSVQKDASWTFCNPPTAMAPSKQPPTKTASGSISRSPALILTTSKPHANQPQNIFTDITSTVYAVPAYTHLPQTQPISACDLGLDVGYIPDQDSSSPSSTTPLPSPVVHSWDIDAIQRPYPIPIQPLISSTLICVLANSANASASTSMLHLHLLHNTNDSTSAMGGEKDLLDAIMKNFHELAILAGLRWRLGPSFMNQCFGADSRGSTYLPFHLGAVNAMKDALERDKTLEACVGSWSGVGEGEGGEL